MLGCRTAYGVGGFVLALGAALGCGGSVAHGVGDPGEPLPGVGGGTSGTSGAVGSAGSRAGSGPAGGGGSSSGAPSGGAAPEGGRSEPHPIDTGCEETEPPPRDLQCDPFDGTSCGPGFGCYPYVVHPDGNGCEQQLSGTTCAPAGLGIQGSLCGAEPETRCAPGFVCVVGQRAGKRCAQLCDLGGAESCGGGLLCGELDVPGFGVCG